MHKVRLTQKKIARRLALIEPLVYRRSHPLAPFHFRALSGPMEPPPIDADSADWDVIEPDNYWARPRTDFILRGSFEIPTEWDQSAAVALVLRLGEPGSFSHPEALIYVDGSAYAACDRHHQEVLLRPEWHDGKTHQLALHGWSGESNRNGATARLFMRACFVGQIDQPTRDFIITARTALDTARVLDEGHPAQALLLNALDDAFKSLDTREPFGDAFYASVPAAQKVLNDGIGKAGAPLDVTIVGAGHAHIDVAWLWTLGQTRHKAGRTFHTVIRYMEQFPNYHFTQSQPQLYDFIRQDYPDLFEAIQARIKEGRWEPIGGMWVEADCNITGPESLARQFLLGRTFFREHFGGEAESQVLWLPDVFGYAWNLPQLIKQAGLEYFFTIKIGWNRYNKMPYDSFWWQGLDGTKVLTHFSTTPEMSDIRSNATYNATPTPMTALGSWLNFQQKEYQQTLLMSYGYGDGGGGPTREMIENISEMEAFPGLPRMKYGKVGDFFRQMEAEAGEGLPTWNGELYLEIHRGTYTTQGRNKRANRKSEFLLHDAEFVAVLASLLDPNYAYPADSLRKAWELVCLNQFHDIIPGSSIADVYVESQAQYAEIRQLAESARDSALAAIKARGSGDLMVINPTSYARDDLVFIPGQFVVRQRIRSAEGMPILAQPTEGGAWLATDEIPAFGVATFTRHPGDDTRPDTGLHVAPDLLENDLLRVEFNAAGDITRIYDQENHREVLPPGAIANHLLAFEDRPVDWDAWDIDIFYDDKTFYAEPATSISVVENGPLRATLEIKRRILNSDVVQRISLAYHSARLDFATTVQWHERHILLKAAFPVDVLTPTATYEIQWGNVQRPTHRNTSWDWARFETCAQKWVDLSEGDYGVSLLNDCKYGHDIQDNVIRISLLRSPTSPDPEADQGEHHFAYSLLPHAGMWNERTVAAAYALNDPHLVIERQRAVGATATLVPHELLATSLVSVDRPNVVIETIKRAEDGNGIIVRLYESQRRRGRVTLTTAFRLDKAYRANLLEENGEELLVNQGEDMGRGNVSFFIKPYEIVTLRLIRA